MDIALKKQAETYFQSTADLQSSHKKSANAGKLNQFYALLLCHDLQQIDNLTSKIIALHETKDIDWKVFVNAIWGYSLSLSETSQQFKSLAQFVASINRKNIVERALFMNFLPDNLIDAANIEKKESLDKKARGAFTKIYYKQTKHNLIRESNEGYAKLCLLLTTINPCNSVDAVWDKILSLVGNFDLDPDRVLDLLIEAYVQTSTSQICLSLIKNFNPHSIVSLIGNKILKDVTPELSQKIIYTGKVQDFLSGTSYQLYQDLNSMINPKLITLLCRLIKEGLISLESIMPYLSPADLVFQREQIKKIQNGKQKISKSFKLVMEELSEEQQLQIKQEENVKFLGQMLYSSKLALMNGFVEANDWLNFMKMWKSYDGKIDLLIYQPLLRSLLNMLQWIIEPLYEKISFAQYFGNSVQKKQTFQIIGGEMESENRVQMTQIYELNEKEFTKIVEIFDIVQIYVGFKSKLYTKICRIFSAFVKQPSTFSSVIPSQSEPQSSIKGSIQTITKLYLLPAISLQSGNPSLPKQIYQLLELFDYKFRFRCYIYHYCHAMIDNPYFAHIFYKTRNKQTVMVNNLSDKNKKVFMKKMAKLTHGQALQTFYWIFRRILLQDYQKVVPEIVGVLGSSCGLTLEMAIFVALHNLNEQKLPAMNFKTGQQAPWFKNIINFISLFYRKYLEIDIQPIFDYIIMKIGQPVKQLEENQQLPGALLKLLHEILSKMFCNFVLKDVNKNKLEMLCAGPKLQLQTMDISDEIKASKKSKVILEKFFWGKSVDKYDGQSLAISLLVLLTQKRAQLLLHSQISNMKMIGDIYDDYTVLIIQLIRVLNELSSDYSQYSKLLPQNSLNLFINQYKLPLEIAFQIFRPSVKHISSMPDEEWKIFFGQVGGVINKYITSGQKSINKNVDNDKLTNYLKQNYLKMENVMSNEFFTTFWMLTLDSIYLPAKLYSEKIEEVKVKNGSKLEKSRSSIKQRSEE